MTRISNERILNETIAFWEMDKKAAAQRAAHGAAEKGFVSFILATKKGNVKYGYKKSG